MKKLLAILLMSTSAITVYAENMGYDETKPIYFNINTGVATGYSFTNNGNNGAPSGAANNNYSLGANIGYNFNPYVATEIGYNNLWLPSTNSNPNGQVGVEDIAAKGTIPLGDIFAIYGRIGLGGYQNTSGGNFANTLGVLYGAGAEWAISKSFAVRLEDWSVTGLGSNIIQVGAQISF